MFIRFLLAACLFCGVGVEAADTFQPVQYKVTRNDYTFSTVFEIATNKGLIGSVVKGALHVRTHYDLYNRSGQYTGQGICRMFCLGMIYEWGTEIDIYDADGSLVGVIDGQVVSTEPAKFSIYDKDYNRVAIAYLDLNCSAFSISDPNNSAHLLARLSRNFIQGTIDHWDVLVYEPEAMDPRIIQIFSAFACDTQDKFKFDD